MSGRVIEHLIQHVQLNRGRETRFTTDAFTPVRRISAASDGLASTRPKATGTTELDAIGEAVVGFRTEAPNPRSDPAASSLDTLGSGARSAGRESKEVRRHRRRCWRPSAERQ
jgi:hypothetical protein